MSSITWTPAEVSSNAQAFSGKIWRMVESQYATSTLQLVDTREEHEILEDILEENKPPIPANARGLDYLLFSPFRYGATASFGTRFRAVGDPGVFYGGETTCTLASEVGYWRWKFLQDSAGLKRLSPSLFTAFRVTLDHRAVDLRDKPFSRDAVHWEHPSDYSATQEFARTVRKSDAGIIIYKSVRCPIASFCAAILTPQAFSKKKPDNVTQSWVLVIADEVIWNRSNSEESFSLSFNSFSAGIVSSKK
ncbi:MAG: RES family NAD+ phosphorylase [Syntrophaceae bacterium]